MCSNEEVEHREISSLVQGHTAQKLEFMEFQGLEFMVLLLLLLFLLPFGQGLAMPCLFIKDAILGLPWWCSD